MVSEPTRLFLASLQKTSFKNAEEPLPVQDPQQRLELLRAYFDQNRPDLSLERRKEELARFYALAVTQAASVPTKYEDPIVYDDLCNVGRAVESAARDLGFVNMQGKVLFGTLNSGRINASTYYCEKQGEYVLTVNLGLWTIARQLAWIITKAAREIVLDDFLDPASYGARIRYRLHAEPLIRTRFITALREWAMRGIVLPHATTYPREELAFGRALQASLKVFTVAHEYGHIVLGHHQVDFDQLGREVPLVAAMGKSVKETAADKAALQIAQQMEESQSLGTRSWAGAAAYFTVTDILSRTLGILKWGDENVVELSETHPQSALRWRSLQEHIQEISRGVQEALVVEIAIRILWEQVRPMVVEMRTNKVDVAIGWQNQAPVGGRIPPY